MESHSYLEDEEYKDREKRKNNDDREVIEIEEAGNNDSMVQETGRIEGEVEEELSQVDAERKQERTSEGANDRSNNDGSRME